MYAPNTKEVTEDTVFLWADSSHQMKWNTSDSQKRSLADFCVTYGGKLIANSAKIRGHIDADSGTFGTQTQRLEINYTLPGANSPQDDRHFVLWHKNFYVEDLSGLNNESGVLVHIKGDIHAQSGQFGNVGDNKDGDSKDVMFIQYTWYPWVYLSESDPWTSQTGPFPDKNAGRTTTYTIYHPNFHITRAGDVFINGKLYTQEGRIGDWNIGKFADPKSHSNKDMIKDCCDTIFLVPGLDEDHRGFIQVGLIRIQDDGNINCYSYQSVAGGPIDWSNANRKWYITNEGVASFMGSSASQYKGTFYSSNGSTFSSSGISLATGSSIAIGSATLNVGQNGFTFSTGASFSGKLNTPGGLDLNGGTLSAGGNIEINSSYIKFGGSKLFSSGALDMNSNQIRNADLATNTTINGVSLQNYVKNIVNQALSNATVVLSVSKNTKGNISDRGYVVTDVTSGGIVVPTT